MLLLYFYAQKGRKEGIYMKLLKDEQERNFLDENSMKAFIEEQEKTEIWKVCYTNELQTLPMPTPNCILFNAASVRQEYQIPETSVSDESIEETMDGCKLALSLPLEKKAIYPMAQTAFVTLLQRAGYGTSPVLLTQKSRPSQKEMSPTDKASVLNVGLECFTNKSLLLIRDEKVRAVLSGDENDYSRLPVSQLYKTLTGKLKEIYPAWKFVMATASHTYFTALVSLNDTKLENELQEIFLKSGINAKGKPMVRMVTSDVGLSGANLFPVLRDNTGREFALGTPLCLTHTAKHNMEDFAKNVAQITAMFRESKEKLEKMMTAQIKHPAGCLRIIAKKCTLPKKFTMNKAAEIEQNYKKCYEIDVYYALFDILDEYTRESDISTARMFNLQEAIARVVFTNMSDYDYEFNWE